ncbi:MAG: hypothetical protein ACYDGR_15330 [Candidatus Dormibacteria bacterium]
MFGVAGTPPPGRVRAAWDRLRLTSDPTWPLLAAGWSLLLFLPIILHGLTHPGSAAPHFGLLAEAFMHGHLDLAARTYDDVLWHGHVYFPWGPLPAVLMMPLVALMGPTAPATPLNLVLMFATIPALRWIFIELGFGEASAAWLSLLTLAGTDYLSAVSANGTYFTEHVVPVFCLAWALALVLRRKWPLLAGVMVGLAALTRAPDGLALVPLLLLLRARGGTRTDLAWLAAGAIPCGLLVLGYNQVRFGSPLESGYGPETLSDPTLIAARNVGLFSLQHLPKNLYYFIFAAPGPAGGESAPVLRFPFVVPSDWGTGLVWLSPWMLAALWARGRQAGLLALGAVLLLTPALLYYSIGWVQFGFRYGIDALPFMAAVAAAGIRRRGLEGWLPLAALYSVTVNLAGAYWLTHRLGG